jgi:hypothetical protein
MLPATHAAPCGLWQWDMGCVHAAGDYPPPPGLPEFLWGLWNASGEIHHGEEPTFARYVDGLLRYLEDEQQSDYYLAQLHVGRR